MAAELIFILPRVGEIQPRAELDGDPYVVPAFVVFFLAHDAPSTVQAQLAGQLYAMVVFDGVPGVVVDFGHSIQELRVLRRGVIEGGPHPVDRHLCRAACQPRHRKGV